MANKGILAALAVFGAGALVWVLARTAGATPPDGGGGDGGGGDGGGGGGGVALTYGNPQLSFTGNEQLPLYRDLHFLVMVTNPGAAQTRTVTLKHAATTVNSPTPNWQTRDTKSLALGTGSSYSYAFDIQMVSRETTYHMYLEDDKGGKSAEAVVTIPL